MHKPRKGKALDELSLIDHEGSDLAACLSEISLEEKISQRTKFKPEKISRQSSKSYGVLDDAADTNASQPSVARATPDSLNIQLKSAYEMDPKSRKEEAISYLMSATLLDIKKMSSELLKDLVEEIPFAKWPSQFLMALSEVQLSALNPETISAARVERLHYLQAQKNQMIASLTQEQISMLLFKVDIKEWPVVLIFALKNEQLCPDMNPADKAHIERVQILKSAILGGKFGAYDHKTTMLDIDKANYDPRRDGPKKPK